MARYRFAIRGPAPTEQPAQCAGHAQRAEPSQFARLEIILLPDTYPRAAATEKDRRGKNPEAGKRTSGKDLS
jgi:hypothetical protein